MVIVSPLIMCLLTNVRCRLLYFATLSIFEKHKVFLLSFTVLNNNNNDNSNSNNNKERISQVPFHVKHAQLR